MPNGTLLIMILTQVILKVAYEMIVLPITIVVTRKTQEYENKLAVNKCIKSLFINKYKKLCMI
jgi:hypothetical protein